SRTTSWQIATSRPSALRHHSEMRVEQQEGIKDYVQTKNPGRCSDGGLSDRSSRDGQGGCSGSGKTGQRTDTDRCGKGGQCCRHHSRLGWWLAESTGVLRWQRIPLQSVSG